MIIVNLKAVIGQMPVASVLSGWSDTRLQTRYTLLRYIKEGNTDVIDMRKPVPRMSFPNGYDPLNNSEDSIEAIVAEAKHRGVALVFP